MPATDPTLARPVLLGRQPERYWLHILETGAVTGPHTYPLPPRRVPWFRADGRILFGYGEVVGPWTPWRVPHRFVRGEVPRGR